MSLVGNEQTKLTATTVNSVAIASIAAGFITPLVAATFDIPGALARGGFVTTLAAVAWLTAGTILHLIARTFLRRLKEP